MKPANPVLKVYTQLPTGIKAAIILILLGIGFILSLKIFKYVKNYMAQPGNVKPPFDIETNQNGNDGNGSEQTAFEPKPFTDAIYNDIYENIGVRNTAAYTDLLNLSNTNLVQVYNDWTHRYFNKEGETLTAAIAGEWGFWYNSFATVRDTLVSKLKALNCN